LQLLVLDFLETGRRHEPVLIVFLPELFFLDVVLISLMSMLQLLDKALYEDFVPAHRTMLHARVLKELLTRQKELI